MTGQTLSHFEILEKLGEGGMGVVYRARDTRLDRFVALKILPADRMANADRRRRFVQEAKAASALNHPNIITIHDIATERNIDYIVMEYVPGKTLDQLIPRRGMRFSDVLSYSIQIADGLAKAHAAGIIHRDLKPSNVIASPDGRIKILDFGLAKLTEAAAPAESDRTLTDVKTADGSILGTISYMSPEQAEGRTLDGRSDIFAMGSLLYEMVTGQRAFQGDSRAATLTAVLRDDPKSASSVADGIPREMERIIQRCLRKDPNRRFQGMADVRVALEELKQESESGILDMPLRGAESAKPGKSKPWGWVAGVVAVLAALGIGAYFGSHGPRAPVAVAWMNSYPLMAMQGVQRHPEFSPDGNQVTFQWQKPGETYFHIFVKLLGPGAPLQLTTAEANDAAPAWSPDGRWIAFTRAEKSKRSLLMIPALGGPERKIADLDAGELPRRCAWFPDSKWIALSKPDKSGRIRLYRLSVETGELSEFSPDGSTSGNDADVSPVISPDGKLMVFTRAPSNLAAELYAVSLREDHQLADVPRKLTVDGRFAVSASFTQSMQEVIFTSGTSFSRSLYRAPVFGGVRSLPLLIRSADNVESVSVARQGDRLVFARAVSDENVWAVDLNTGKPPKPELLIQSTRREFEPRFSRDGQRIAFTSDRVGSGAQVWVSAADGSNPTQLTNMGGNLTSAARFSPDGQSIVFISNAEGQSEIYLMKSTGGPATRLTNHPAHDTAPSWSHDGKWIYFGSERTPPVAQIFKMRPDSKSNPIQVTQNGGIASLESEDGKTLYFTKRNQSGVWKMPVDGGPETKVIEELRDWGNMAITERGLFFIPNRDKGAAVQFYNFQDERTTEVVRLSGRPGFGLTATPDGKRILVTQIDQETNELVVVENFR